MKIALAFILLFIGTISNGQINLADSTVQVISYWDKAEKQNYSVTLEKTKIKGEDTTSTELTTYEVEVTVLDSSQKSYTIQWLYKNFKTNNQNPTIQKLVNISKDLKVIFKTDEVGTFLEVLNWKEIRDFNQKAITTLRNDLKSIPEMDKVLDQMYSTFSTKESIESYSIKDIQQFHNFHGAKYKLGEIVEAKLQLPHSLFGSELLDANLSVYLDEINNSENNYVMRSSQEVDKDQLINATVKYVNSLNSSGKGSLVSKDDFKEMVNEKSLASRIHDSGWIIYSIETTVITTDSLKNIEERIIEIK